MNVVYAMTRNVYPWAFPSMRSLRHHNPKAMVFVVCEDDEIGNLPIKAEIINVKDQKWFPESGVNYHNPFTYINLIKAVYPSILPVQKVIHLDIDTIVNDSLEGLWKTNLDGKWWGAVPQFRGEFTLYGDKYYNMGVAVINLSQMRKDKAEAGMVEYLNTVKTEWADQDVWNIHTDKAVPVDVRYNENWATGETQNPAIVHYCGINDWFGNPFMYRAGYLKEWGGC